MHIVSTINICTKYKLFLCLIKILSILQTYKYNKKSGLLSNKLYEFVFIYRIEYLKTNNEENLFT